MSTNSEKLLRAALREQESRRRQVERLRGSLFEAQLKIMDDPCRLKTALCTRRAGKTNGAAGAFLEASIKNPGSNFLFCALTTKSALGIIWKDVLRPMAKRNNIRAVLKKQDNEIQLGNHGTSLFFMGINATKEEREKALGRKYKKVIIDESASIQINVEEFVYRHILPALADEQGDLWLIGTPSDLTKSFFYRATMGEIPGWSNHEWSALDNPHMREQWLKEIAYLKETRPGIEDTPWFIQNYLGKWAVDDSKRVYRYSESVNLIDQLPDSNDWKSVLGIDLGYSPDPTAFVVSSYREQDPRLYYRHAYKRTEMTLSDVSAYAHMLNGVFHFESMVVDNANKQAVEELKQKYNLPLIAADKTGKVDHIAMMNDDFQLGRIKVVKGTCDPLIDEWTSHIWDERAREKGQFKESEQTANHCCDAGLYNWRHCFHWVDRNAPEVRAPVEQREVEEYWKQKAQELETQAEQDVWEDESVW